MSSMKTKLSGGAAQTNGLAVPGVLLTRSILSSNNVPEPDNGVTSFEKADTRRVLIVPVPRIFPATFQFPPVRPAFCTGGLEKVTTDESKVKSPWKPT